MSFSTWNHKAIAVSNDIHLAQATSRALNNPSLPILERLTRALKELTRITYAQANAETLQPYRANLAKVTIALVELGEAYGRSEEMSGRGQLDDRQEAALPYGAQSQRLSDAIDEASSYIIKTELDRIVTELDASGRILPVGAIREAREHRDLMVPRLTQVLREAITAAREGNIPQGNAYFIGLFLLTEFQAREAFTVILEAFTLPDDLPYDLFSDALTEFFPRVLALFDGENAETIERIIGDRALDEFVRAAAVLAYGYLARDGRLSYDEVVNRLRRHLRRATAENDKEIAGELVAELADLAAAESLGDIRDAFLHRAVDESLIDLRSAEEMIAEGKPALQAFYKNLPPTGMPDTIEELSDWAAFGDGENEWEKAAEEDDDANEEDTPFAQRWSPLGKPSFHDTAYNAEDENKAIFATPPPLAEPIRTSGPRIGRNDPCPCGSGKKFKKCCGARG